MSLPPELWSLPAGLDPRVGAVFGDLIRYLEGFESRLIATESSLSEAYRMLNAVFLKADPVLEAAMGEAEKARKQAEALEVELEALKDTVDAIRGEFRASTA